VELDPTPRVGADTVRECTRLVRVIPLSPARSSARRDEVLTLVRDTLVFDFFQIAQTGVDVDRLLDMRGSRFDREAVDIATNTDEEQAPPALREAVIGQMEIPDLEGISCVLEVTEDRAEVFATVQALEVGHVLADDDHRPVMVHVLGQHLV